MGAGRFRHSTKTSFLIGDAFPVAILDMHKIVLSDQGKELCGRGIDWIDAHLLSSALLSQTKGEVIAL
jgi:hypothetical protein